VFSSCDAAEVDQTGPRHPSHERKSIPQSLGHREKHRRVTSSKKAKECRRSGAPRVLSVPFHSSHTEQKRVVRIKRIRHVCQALGAERCLTQEGMQEVMGGDACGRVR